MGRGYNDYNTVRNCCLAQSTYYSDAVYGISAYILCSTATSIHIIIKLILLLLLYESVIIFYVVGERKHIYLPRVSAAPATPSIALYEQRVSASQTGPRTQPHCSRLSQSVPAIGAV